MMRIPNALGWFCGALSLGDTVGYAYDFVTPRLATGGGITTDGFVQTLAAAGVTHIIDVTDAEDDASLLATHPSILYCYNPTADDGSHKDPAWFAKSLAFALPAFAQAPARVYAHCSSGVNRGPSTAYVIMRALGWSGDEAYARLKAARPQVNVAYRKDADEAIKALGFE